MVYNADLELEKHRKEFGTTYKLPDGTFKLIKDKDLGKFLKENKLKLHEPSHQGSSEKEAQVGIKHG